LSNDCYWLSRAYLIAAAERPVYDPKADVQANLPDRPKRVESCGAKREGRTLVARERGRRVLPAMKAGLDRLPETQRNGPAQVRT
jgi:hypothetical protein